MYEVIELFRKLTAGSSPQLEEIETGFKFSAVIAGALFTVKLTRKMSKGLNRMLYSDFAPELAVFVDGTLIILQDIETATARTVAKMVSDWQNKQNKDAKSEAFEKFTSLMENDLGND